MSWSGPLPAGVPSLTNIFQPFTDHATDLKHTQNLEKREKTCLKLCTESQ